MMIVKQNMLNLSKTAVQKNDKIINENIGLGEIDE